jgi:hypothetical protein
MLNVKKNLSSLQKIKVSLSSNTKYTCSGQMAVQCRETAYSLSPSNVRFPTNVASKVFWSQKTPGGDSDESPPFA